jgi:hypothetical protein
MYVLYYASMFWYWHLVWILVSTNHPCLGVRCHIRYITVSQSRSSISLGVREMVTSLNKPEKANLCIILVAYLICLHRQELDAEERRISVVSAIIGWRVLLPHTLLLCLNSKLLHKSPSTSCPWFIALFVSPWSMHDKKSLSNQSALRCESLYMKAKPIRWAVDISTSPRI